MSRTKRAFEVKACFTSALLWTYQTNNKNVAGTTFKFRVIPFFLKLSLNIIALELF